MIYVLLTVVSYLLFNWGVWLSTLGGSELAVGIGYLVGCGLIGLKFNGQIKQQRASPIKWKLVLFGTTSILVTINALRYAHSQLPLSLSMEAIYNGLALGTWPTFLILHRFWPATFKDRPKWFDLGCHAVMLLLVLTRFLTYGEYHLTGWTILAIVCGAAGYIGVNIAVMLIAGHRVSNILIVAIAALILLCGQIGWGAAATWSWNLQSLGAVTLVALASYGIPVYLTAAYAHFKSLASLVPPLVFDSLLVASPLMMVVRGELISIWTVIVAVGMVVVTVARYRYHMGRQIQPVTPT